MNFVKFFHGMKVLIMFVYLGFSSLSRNFHSWMWRRHHYRWRASNVGLYSHGEARVHYRALGTVTRDTVYTVVSENPWVSHPSLHSHLFSESLALKLSRIEFVSTGKWAPAWEANAQPTVPRYGSALWMKCELVDFFHTMKYTLKYVS